MAAAAATPAVTHPAGQSPVTFADVAQSWGARFVLTDSGRSVVARPAACVWCGDALGDRPHITLGGEPMHVTPCQGEYDAHVYGAAEPAGEEPGAALLADLWAAWRAGNVMVYDPAAEDGSGAWAGIRDGQHLPSLLARAAGKGR